MHLIQAFMRPGAAAAKLWPQVKALPMRGVTNLTGEVGPAS